jgi:tetratricopeptide (TPR) repeat protein
VNEHAVNPQAQLPDDTALATLRHAAAALSAVQSRGKAYEMSEALADLARACRALQDMASAETYFEQALRWARCTGSVDQVVNTLCELCEVAAHLAQTRGAGPAGSRQAARERARGHAFEAGVLAGGVADARWEVKVLLRISDVLDRFGDRDDAVLLQTRALRLMSGQVQAGNGLDAALLPGLGRLADS